MKRHRCKGPSGSARGLLRLSMWQKSSASTAAKPQVVSYTDTFHQFPHHHLPVCSRASISPFVPPLSHHILTAVYKRLNVHCPWPFLHPSSRSLSFLLHPISQAGQPLHHRSLWLPNQLSVLISLQLFTFLPSARLSWRFIVLDDCSLLFFTAMNAQPLPPNENLGLRRVRGRKHIAMESTEIRASCPSRSCRVTAACTEPTKWRE